MIQAFPVQQSEPLPDLFSPKLGVPLPATDTQNDIMALLPTFYSPPTKIVWDATPSINQTLPALSLAEMETLAMANLRANLALGPGVDMASIRSHVGVNQCYTYLKQSVNGVEIANTAASASVRFTGQVYSRTSAWVNMKPDDHHRLAKRAVDPQKINATQAVFFVAKTLGKSITPGSIQESPSTDDSGKIILSGAKFTTAEIIASSKLYMTPDGLHTVWDLSIPMPEAWLNVFVDDITGSILGASNWMSSLSIVSKDDISSGLQKRQKSTIQPVSYLIVPLGGRDIRTSVGTQLVQNPEDLVASPLGWHNTDNGIGNIASTFGNNVIAQENRKNQPNPILGLRPSVNTFSFQFSVNDIKQSPEEYADASIVNTFAMTNLYHDILYQYGFTEAAGNFQVNNFGRGGKGGDPVIANVQDGSGVNNANFATPPDGQAGIMRMFIFTSATPNRDGALENSVALHELTHGLSNRLTGGPANANCLSSTIALGLGEGWSDVVALSLEVLPTDTRNDDRVMGAYVTNNPKRGIRLFPYSTNMNNNPHTYADVLRNSNRHYIGEIWASMLWELYWNLVEKLGFSTNIKDGAKSGKGNTVFLQLIVDGMKLQPCNPTFIQARNAIVRADRVANNGTNFCLIATAFAKRGLGQGVKDNEFYFNDFTFPANCN
ncbi:hypothetical protein QVD99_000461 [Batrachochytrium dendrobatidis]|nr:hypothetical protein QVD99_000461 [Batrachochytrium dendrobatidis]